MFAYKGNLSHNTEEVDQWLKDIKDESEKKCILCVKILHRRRRSSNDAQKGLIYIK